MSEMNIKILTIPKHLHRNYMLIGHLETMEFPVTDLIANDHMKFYNGFDWNDYKTNAEITTCIVNDGWSQWKEKAAYYNRPEFADEKPLHSFAVEWGFLNIMKKIVEDDKPALVLESDVKFETLTYDKLREEWKMLIDIESEQNILVAQLCFEVKEGLPPVTPLTQFWARGSKGRGQYANIVTPAGAEFLMNRKDATPTIENYLPRYPETPGFYTTHESQYRWCNLSSTIYPHRNSEMFDPMHEKIKGTQL